MKHSKAPSVNKYIWHLSRPMHPGLETVRDNAHGNDQFMEQTISERRQLDRISFPKTTMRLAKESLVIVGIGSFDLVSTLIWVNSHGAQEANPLFRYYLAMGPYVFVAMKFIMLMAPIFLLEWASHRRPVFTRWASRFAIVAYLGLYAAGVARLNPHFLGHRSEPTSIAYLDAESVTVPSNDPLRGFSPGAAASSSTMPTEGMN